MKTSLLSLSLMALLGVVITQPVVAQQFSTPEQAIAAQQSDGVQPGTPPKKLKPKYYGAHLCGYSGFTCVKVQPGDTWAKMFPIKRQREIVKRLNRTNVALRHRDWIVIPANLDKITNMDMSPFPSQITPNGKRTIIVKLGLHAFGAYDENGKLVHWGPVSGGKGWCDDVNRACKTATGDHKVYRKQGVGCISSVFPVETGGGAPMPYCMHYFQGYALHGSTLPGFHASHGCIRLFNDDAKWLNKYFVRVGSKIIVDK